MGSSCSRCSCGKKEKDHYRCVIVGLDGAGKTTLFNYICDKNQGEKQPISGFEICSREYDKIIFDFWDTNGDACCRQFWTHYIFGAHAIIFVVDSTNRERFPEVKAELIKLLNCEGTEVFQVSF
ncbi:uncharacterized protein [Blastocystis hominis]|uniref:Uncharacterized protein n=1 Tax=Blastocystis hominis TaxID=12968 RepID=D8M3A4_BLAHO|nr:uncharacterized protein [Blastocystis hominis]CBK22377.2 unnamed protein product [Blastocystis hominis]|eukprot:XP_012896425.1 uncharacterized protein [Blastocystis hominis]